MNIHTCLLGLAVVAASVVALPADAVVRTNAVNASGVCQPALPVYDGNIRKRPAAIANEGDTVAFVSCSVVGDIQSSRTFGFGLLVSNNTTAPVTVNCTHVNGVRQGTQGPSLQPVNLLVEPGMSSEIVFTDQAFPNQFSRPVQSLSCALPPGTELNALLTGVEDAPEPQR